MIVFADECLDDKYLEYTMTEFQKMKSKPSANRNPHFRQICDKNIKQQRKFRVNVLNDLKELEEEKGSDESEDSEDNETSTEAGNTCDVNGSKASSFDETEYRIRANEKLRARIIEDKSSNEDLPLDFERSVLYKETEAVRDVITEITDDLNVTQWSAEAELSAKKSKRKEKF
jgi:hypothetical protein